MAHSYDNTISQDILLALTFSSKNEFIKYYPQEKHIPITL